MVITLFLILKTGTQNWTPYLKIKNMVKELNKSIDLKFEELEDRLEMAQVAAGEVVRCNIGDVTR